MRSGYQTFDRIILDVEITLCILRQMGFAQRKYSTTTGYIHCLQLYYIYMCIYYFNYLPYLFKFLFALSILALTFAYAYFAGKVI